ncbi:MAG: exo-beta-N-acetylmuramidase NamZ domain-containing protein [Gemmatimonadaceae bacterium]
MMRYHTLLVMLLPICGGCVVTSKQIDPTSELAVGKVRPGITTLLSDSIHLIRGKRIGLLTNQTGINERGTSDIDLLRDKKARDAGVRLVQLFSPEHGLRGEEDRPNIANSIDQKSGLPVYSLYGQQTMAPPDSLLSGLDALVFDLQDIGTRTWTYVGAMIYSMRAAARLHKPIIVLDRPNPITGYIIEGPLLDSSLANPEDPAPGRPGQAYALWPMPLRHGMTMGELALYFNDVLRIRSDLHVVPAQGWRRDVWFDLTGLPWVKPSPNMPSLQSAMLYPGLVAFEATNLSVGRGTPEAFQRVGAPWLNAAATVAILRDREIPGVRFFVENFTPQGATDGKYSGQNIPGIKIVVINRSALQAARVGASLLWAINKTAGSKLTIRNRDFDLRFGSPPVREALLRGDDPDVLIDREYKAAYAFRQSTRQYLIYK